LLGRKKRSAPPKLSRLLLPPRNSREPRAADPPSPEVSSRSLKVRVVHRLSYNHRFPGDAK
jgi:hypothetical protein